MNKKIIDTVIQSIDSGLFIQKILDDFNHGRKSYHETIQTTSIGVSVFIKGSLIRSHCFGKQLESIAVVKRSITKGEKLLEYPEQFRSSNAEAGLGGALASDGVIISVSGFKNEARCEYFAWVILNTIERRLNECNFSLDDYRFKTIENNSYIKREITRLAELNFQVS